jgi:hypothetical protein
MTPSTPPLGGPLCAEIVGPDLIPAEGAVLLTDAQVEVLWGLFRAIGRWWGNVVLDSANLRSTWLEFLDCKTTTAESYTGEYASAVRVIEELRGMHGEDAFPRLFLERPEAPRPPPPALTRLEHARRYVVDEFIRVQVLAGGFKGFFQDEEGNPSREAPRNYGGYLGGSRYNLRPVVRAYRPAKEGGKP